MKILIFTLLLIAFLTNAQQYELKKLGQFRMRYPAHMRLMRLPHRNSSYSLVTSSFEGNPLTWSTIFEVPNVAEAIKNPRDIPRIRAREIAPRFTLVWSNEINRIPFEVFNHDYIYNTDGFLVPFHDNGKIVIFKVIPGTGTGLHRFNRPNVITQPNRNGWFYHNVLWVDMNGDGKIDVITARASLRQGRENAVGELLWLEHPQTNAETTRWKEHVLMKGPDVSFKSYDFLKRKNQLQIVACQFWKKETALINIEYGIRGSEPKVLWQNVVDNTIGFPYDVRITDLNGDGKVDLLVTNHEDNEKDSGLFAFEVPSDIRNGVFKKHVISKGFITRQPGDYEASPGFPFAFYPTTNKRGRPHLMVAGDGTQQAYYFYPIGSTGFKYGGGPFVNVGGVVGDIAYADIDNDGYMEVFVPNYHGGEMHVFKFQDKRKDHTKEEMEELINSLTK